MRKMLKGAITGLMMGLAMLLTGCTQPDGYIGEWFGSWHLEQILIDGEEDSTYNEDPNIMFSFQGKIFNCAYIENVEIYGSWSYAGEVLTLVAGYDTGSGSTVTSLFNPFPVALHFPAHVEQIEITVTHISGKTMQWQYIDQNGRLLTYNFRKYP